MLTVQSILDYLEDCGYVIEVKERASVSYKKDKTLSLAADSEITYRKAITQVVAPTYLNELYYHV